MINGFHHIAIILKSEESISFYEKLGFSVFKRVERSRDVIVLMSGYGMQLEIFVDPAHDPRPTPEPLGLRHIALRVDRIEKTIEDLRLDIVPILSDWFGERFCFVVDPDGNTIELHESE